LTRLINPESQVELQNQLTLEDMGMPSEKALAAGLIQLYAQKLKKVVVADELQIAPEEVTDSELAALCDSIRDDPTDILVLCGSRLVTDISCLVQLSTISHLDISSCDLGAQGGFHLAGVIKDMGSLTKLDVSNNNLGDLAYPDGWRIDPRSTEDPNEYYKYIHSDGREQDEDPGEAIVAGIAEGAIVLAGAIKGMGALTSLNLSSNNLQAEGGKMVAEAIKVTNCAIAVVLAAFACPSDHWMACCCLLLSTG
jgi:hypothetical protein